MERSAAVEAREDRQIETASAATEDEPETGTGTDLDHISLDNTTGMIHEDDVDHFPDSNEPLDVIDYGDVSPPSVDSQSMYSEDSALGGMSILSTTTSVRSSIYGHIEENGRTYHRYKEGKYMLPNDELERDRLDLQHELFRLTFHNQLFLSPLLEVPPRVLDFGTGTGIWAIDFASLFPSADVLGTDLSPIQPEFVPPNCPFEIDDSEDDWTFSHKFDFIHGRALGTCFKDPAAVLASAFECLNPGGYLEMQDAIMPMAYTGEIPTESALYKWNTYVVEASIRAGRPWTNVRNYATWFREIGFEDVNEKIFYWPTNPWAKGDYFKTISRYFQRDMLDGLEGLTMKLFTNFLGWSKEAVQVFLVDVKNDFKNPNIRAYVHIAVVYGRKPLEA